MANSELIAGTQTYLLYGAESTYGTAATVDKGFGIVRSFKPSGTRNVSERYGMKGSGNTGREGQKFTAGKYESSFSVDLDPQFWDWLEYVLGSVSGAGSSGDPYVYVAGVSPSSITVSNSLNNDTTDREEKYLGCMVSSMTLKASVGEPVSVTLDFISADMDKDATLPSNISSDTGEVYSFEGATLEVPNASAVSNIIDSIEITINTGAEIYYGLGSFVGQIGKAKKLEYSIKCNLKYLDETFIEYFLGNSTDVATPTAIASLGFKITNGATKSVDFVFSNLEVQNFDEELEVNELVVEDITFKALSLTVTEVQTA